MLRGIRENARTLRALTAVCVAGALAVVLFVNESEQNRARERAVFATNAALWKMSEMIFEGQRLATELMRYSAGHGEKADVELRFDILWSRLDVLEAEGLSRIESFSEPIAHYQQFLEREEPTIYDADAIAAAEVLRVHTELELLVLEARGAWTEAFAAGQGAQGFAAAYAGRNQRSFYSEAAVFLISVLMLYVLAEVFFAGRAQARERVLREEAAEASSAKSLFLANVSHEIRTPLNGILGMTGELLESRLTADQRACLSVIEQSGGLLLSTINDVLDLSKVESGRFELEERTFNLAELLETARALYAQNARDKSVGLTLWCEPSLGDWAIGDGRRLSQVLHNLVANAVKFTSDGQVEIMARREAGNDWVSIYVCDSGPGIAPDAQERIFEPFRQEDVSTARRYGGTGLGLAISRQICRAMGGDLTLQSEPGSGAIFCARVPLPATAPPKSNDSQGSTVARAPNLSAFAVLIADDNATNRLILSRFLAQTGCRIEFALNGMDAVTMASSTVFDVILMDINMPGLGGVDAAEQIRGHEAQWPDRRAHIVAVTANAMPHQASRYLSLGMDDVLTKPVSKQELFDKLDDLRHRASRGGAA